MFEFFNFSKGEAAPVDYAGVIIFIQKDLIISA